MSVNIDNVIFAMLVLCVFVVAFVFFMQPEEDEVPQPAKLCSENETRQCMVGNCSGEQRCIDGRWTSCRVKMICVPGSKVPCATYGCAYGYKTCNECGSGYGECE